MTAKDLNAAVESAQGAMSHLIDVLEYSDEFQEEKAMLDELREWENETLQYLWIISADEKQYDEYVKTSFVKAND